MTPTRSSAGARLSVQEPRRSCSPRDATICRGTRCQHQTTSDTNWVRWRQFPFCGNNSAMASRPWASIQGGCGHNRPARRGAGSDRGCLARFADLASASSRCPRPAPASGCGSGSECGRGRGGPCAPAPAEGRRHVLAHNSAITTSTCRSLPSVVISTSLTRGQHIAGEPRERHSRIERAGQHVHHCCGLVANSTSSGMPAARHRSRSAVQDSGRHNSRSINACPRRAQVRNPRSGSSLPCPRCRSDRLYSRSSALAHG